MRDFRSLKVWERAHQLTLSVYRATESFPTDERFGLTAQIRRACSSIPTNIAEGCGRTGERELGRFMRIATGSASELEYQLLLARDLAFLEDKPYQQLTGEVSEIRQMLAGFLRKLNAES